MNDPRGPRRTIVATDSDASTWYLTLDCGHVSHGTRHMWFDVGKPHHCMKCRNATVEAE